MFIFYMSANFFLIPEFDQTPCPFEWNQSTVHPIIKAKQFLNPDRKEVNHDNFNQ